MSLRAVLFEVIDLVKDMTCMIPTQGTDNSTRLEAIYYKLELLQNYLNSSEE